MERKKSNKFYIYIPSAVTPSRTWLWQKRTRDNRRKNQVKHQELTFRLSYDRVYGMFDDLHVVNGQNNRGHIVPSFVRLALRVKKFHGDKSSR